MCTGTPISQRIKNYETEIAELKRQLEEASKGALACANRILQQEQKIGSIYQQLTESQAREAWLREALEYKHDAVQSLMTWCIKNINGWSFPQYDHLDYANAKMAEALALPHDDCIATTNQVLDGLEGADNVADALRVMKGGA